MKLQNPNSKPILLPMALSESKDETRAIEFAFWLASTFKRPLRAIHIVPDWTFVPPMPGLRLAIPNVSKELEEAENRICKALHSFTSNTLYGDVVVSAQAYYGTPAKWISAESGQSSFTVMSSQKPKSGIFRRLTTVFRVLAHCEGPVAIVPNDKPFTYPAESLKIMLADDLESHTHDAADLAAWFASRFKHSELTQVHVTPITPDVLERSVQFALAGSQNSGEVYPSIQSLHEKMMQDLRETMAARFSKWINEMELGDTSYSPCLMQGHAGESIEEVRKKIQPDIEVYGQHQSYHGNAFGKVSFEAMMQGENPVIVVPSK